MPKLGRKTVISSGAGGEVNVGVGGGRAHPRSITRRCGLESGAQTRLIAGQRGPRKHGNREVALRVDRAQYI